MNAEIVKYLKANNLPVTGKSTDTKEQTAYRINAYKQGRDFVFTKWIGEKKYKELISCAHGGWFCPEEFLVPLAQHFSAEKDLSRLRLLCERGIRFNLEDVIRLMKNAKEVSSGHQADDIIADVLMFAAGKKHHADFENGVYANAVEDVAKWQGRALRKLDRYMEFLEGVESGEYLQTIKSIREKTSLLKIRKSDLSAIQFKE